MISNQIPVVYLISGVLLFLLGLLILRERPRQRVNRVTSAMLFFAAVGPIFAAFGLLLEKTPEAVGGLGWLQRLFLIWEFFFPELLLFSLVFPREHRILQARPRLPLLIFLPQAWHFLLILFFDSSAQIRYLFTPENLLPQLGPFFEPVRLFFRLFLDSIALVYDYHEAFFALVNLIYVVLTIFNLQRSYHRLESSRLHKQVRLIVWGIRVSAGFYAIAFLLPKFLFLQVSLWQAYILTSLGLLLAGLSIAWAIIRHHFLDIQFILRRGFVFSLTSGVLVGIYLLLYAEVRRAASLTFGENSRFVEALFLIVAIIAFQPLLNFFETLLDRVLYRHAGDYRRSLQELSQEVLTILEPEKLREKVVNGLTETLLAETVYLLLPEDDALQTPLLERPHEQVRIARNGEMVRYMLEAGNPVLESDMMARISNMHDQIALRKLRAEILFPLVHRQNLLGALVLGRKITHTSYSYEELTLLQLLAEQLAIALENMQLYREKLEKQRIEEEIKVAEEIQRSLLPRECPNGVHFELVAMNIPSRVIGGDFYDFIQFSDSRLAIAIGDVSGKGIPGAMLMSNFHAAFRAYALRYPSPRRVVSQVNDHISLTTSPEKFVTFFYGVLDCNKYRFTFTNAGHNYPLLCRDGVVMPIKEHDLVVGIRPGVNYHQKTIKLQPGDTIIFYTDGVTEAFNEEEAIFGEERLTRLILQYRDAPIDAIREQIYQEVCHFSPDANLQDDFTLIILRLK